MINCGLKIIDNNGGLIPGNLYCFIGDKKVGKTTILTCIQRNCNCSIVCNNTNEYESPLITNPKLYKPEYNTDFIYNWNKIISHIESILESDIIPTLIVDIEGKSLISDCKKIANTYNIPVIISIENNNDLIEYNDLNTIILKLSLIENNDFSRKIEYYNQKLNLSILDIIEFDFNNNNIKK